MIIGLKIVKKSQEPRVRESRTKNQESRDRNQAGLQAYKELKNMFISSASEKLTFERCENTFYDGYERRTGLAYTFQ